MSVFDTSILKFVFPLCATPHPLGHVSFLSWTDCLQYECGRLLQFLLAAVEFGVINSWTAVNADHTFWNLEYFRSLQDLRTFCHTRVALKVSVCLFVRHVYRYSYNYFLPSTGAQSKFVKYMLSRVVFKTTVAGWWRRQLHFPAHVAVGSVATHPWSRDHNLLPFVFRLIFRFFT